MKKIPNIRIKSFKRDLSESINKLKKLSLEQLALALELRLISKKEYELVINIKVRKGQRLFLLDPLVPITEEDIESNQDLLWDA